MMASSNHSIATKRSKRSCGFTLIELVLVLSLLSTFLAGTIGLISIVRDSDAQAKQNLARRMELRRFTNDVRRDVRTADIVAVTDSQLVITTKSPTSQLKYQAESNQHVTRTITNADNSIQAQDRYAIGQHAEISLTSLDDRQTIQWTITELDHAASPTQITATQRTVP